MASYRVVCHLCRTRVTSASKDGNFEDYAHAVKAIQGHLKYSAAHPDALTARTREAVATESITEAECVPGC